MNTIVSIRARARARAFPVDARSGIAALRSISPSTPLAIAPGRVALRAHWSRDPISGRLECRWSAENAEPGSRLSTRRATEALSQAA